MHRPLLEAGVCCAFLLASVVAPAQTPRVQNASGYDVRAADDAHVTSDPARELYKSCAYAHGYIHGYEDGFHYADLDIHMGHSPRSMNGFKAYRSAAGYRSDFGNRDFFRLGYQHGFRAAYTDGMRGDAFRGLSSLRRVAAGFRGFSSQPKQFEQAFSTGYDSGYTEGERQSQNISPQMISEHCGAGHPNGEYCDAYARGFRLGYSDGNANPLQTQTAEKK